MNKITKGLGIGAIALGIGLGLAGGAYGMGKKPEYTPEQIETFLKSRQYSEKINDVEIITYNKNYQLTISNEKYMPVKYYSNVDKKTNEINLKYGQMIYDGIIIEGEKWFRQKTVKALDLLREKCIDDYEFIRDGEIKNNEYHRGVGKIIQQKKVAATTAWKERDIIDIGTSTIHSDLIYFASGIVNEGHRLVKYYEWEELAFKLGAAVFDEQEGVKVKLNAIRKMDKYHYSIPYLEKLLTAKTDEEYNSMLGKNP